MLLPGHIFSHVFQEVKSCLRLVKVLTGEFMSKNLCRIFKFVYRCVLKILSFTCLFNAATTRNRELCYQDSFFAHSWFDGLLILFVVEESVT